MSAQQWLVVFDGVAILWPLLAVACVGIGLLVVAR